jgi:hypothetical protein
MRAGSAAGELIAMGAPMYKRILGWTVVLFVVTASTASRAEPGYVVEGYPRGYFCSYYFFCKFLVVDGVKVGKGEIKELPSVYGDVSEYKAGGDGRSALCWVKSKSRWGWFAVLWDWWNDALVFYAKQEGGRFEKLGSPDFIVFECRKSDAETDSSGRVPSSIVDKCFGRGGVEKYLVLLTTDLVTTLCPDTMTTEQKMPMLASMSEFYKKDDGDCKTARISLMTPVQERATAAFKKDGEEAFCKWAKAAFARRMSEVVDRFAK